MTVLRNRVWVALDEQGVNSALRLQRLPPGTTLGAFEILDFIAAGGMGAVYKARNRISGDLRALKVIRPDLVNDARFVSRFARELTLAVAVGHPHLVRAMEPAMDGSTMFLPMELLQGETLATRLRREGSLGAGTVVAILGPVCDAVAALHLAGIVHRDLKPSNVFLARGSDGAVIPKVLDLGAAMPPESTVDPERAVIGTPWYMAPEQASHGAPVDARADQYAIGVMAYQMLTAHRPFESDVLAHLRRGTPAPLPSDWGVPVAADVEAVVMRALSRDPRARFDTVQDFATALAHAARRPSGHTGPTVVVDTAETVPRWMAPADLEPTTSLRVLPTPVVLARPRTPAAPPRGPGWQPVIVATLAACVALWLAETVLRADPGLPGTPGVRHGVSVQPLRPGQCEGSTAAPGWPAP